MHPYFHGASEASHCTGRYIPSLPQHAGNKLLGCRSPGHHDEWLAMTVHGRHDSHNAMTVHGRHDSHNAMTVHGCHDSHNQRLKRGDDWRMGWGSLCGTSEHGPSSHARYSVVMGKVSHWHVLPLIYLERQVGFCASCNFSVQATVIKNSRIWESCWVDLHCKLPSLAGKLTCLLAHLYNMHPLFDRHNNHLSCAYYLR